MGLTLDVTGKIEANTEDIKLNSGTRIAIDLDDFRYYARELALADIVALAGDPYVSALPSRHFGLSLPLSLTLIGNATPSIAPHSPIGYIAQ